MAPDEVLAWIKVPKAIEGEFSRVYKISKRFEDDISAVCLSLNLHSCQRCRCAAHPLVQAVWPPLRCAPVKPRQPWWAKPGPRPPSTQAMQPLRDEFTPISDMRATAAYRSTVLGNLLQRFWLESQGQRPICEGLIWTTPHRRWRHEHPRHIPIGGRRYGPPA
jgi:xanthine dehydrogenase small subunit